MTTNRSSTDVPDHRVGRRPSPHLRLVLAFAGLVAVGLTQTGCRSNGCSTCGFGSKLTNGVQALSTRVFHHKDKGGCSTCGTLGTEEGVVVEQGVPIVTTPGAVAIPAPGTVVAPPPAEADPRLEPIPSTAPPVGAASPTSTNRSSAGATRSAYEASNRQSGVIASKRSTELTKTYEPSVPTRAAYAPEEPDVFDHLPPVDLPADLTRKVTPLEAPRPSGSTAQPASPPDSNETGDLLPPVSAAPDSADRKSPAEARSVGDRPVLAGSKTQATSNPRATPGMSVSASVAPTIAGGSLPSAEGLDWLKEKGYRTLVDLRPRAEVDPDFPDQVNDHGMLYVALPFAINPINLARLTRFTDLLGQKDQRPLYFCDGDGRRAGLIWYLKLRSQDREETNLARSKAIDVGLLPTDIDRAEQFLKLNFAMEVAPIPTIELAQVVDARPAPAPTGILGGAPPMTTAPIRSHAEPTSSDSTYGRSPSWKPVAALVLSGLGVPLAYWSGSNLLQKRIPRRASLTAKGPGPRKSLPRSDA